MSRPTEGPWVYDLGERDDDFEIYQDDVGTGAHIATAHGEPDARLIAAAPDMLAALKNCELLALEAFKFIDADQEMKAMKLLKALAGELPSYRPDIDQIRAAIAKAEGTST